MWQYAVALIAELGLVYALLTRYRRRRASRHKSDMLRMAQEHYKTQKFRAEINKIKEQRSMIQDMEDSFR